MASIEIKINMAGMNKVKVPTGVKDLIYTADAVRAGTLLGQQTWMEYISGVNVTYSGGTFSLSRQSGQYQQAVMAGMQYPFQGNALHGAIVVNLDYVDIIERGFNVFAMKQGILKGRPYVNVPIEENMSKVPNIIKTNLNTEGRLISTRIGGGLRTTDIGKRSKLTPQEMGMKPYTWRTGLYTGLQSGSGGQPVKFRRISEKTPDSAFVHPGAGAKPVSKALEENLRQPIENIIRAGFEADMKLGST